MNLPVRLFVVFFTVSLVALSGCTDNPFTPEDPLQSGFQENEKLRHRHLFSYGNAAGKLLERYESQATATEFIVGARHTVDIDELVERYESEEGVMVKRVYRHAYKGFAVHIDSAYVPAVLDKMEQDDDIEWVEPDTKLQRVQPKLLNQKGKPGQIIPWGIERIGAVISSTKAGDHKGDVDVDVYIMDSGVAAHDMRIVENVDFTGSGSHHNDELGHGTHVAGTVAAIDDYEKVVGVAPGARVHNLKVLNDEGRTDLSTAIAAVDYVTGQKLANLTVPMVVNISFGGDVGTVLYNGLDAAIAASIATGVVYIIAAGNEGIDAATITPAHVVEAITVGAYDESDQFVTFSNYGAVVDLLAPGVNIPSLSLQDGKSASPALMSGTSAAAPHVTGAVALYLSKHPLALPTEVHLALLKAAKPSVKQVPFGTTNLSVYTGDF